MIQPAVVSASFRSALQAAREAAGSQNYPQGTLYVVATPIGNLADVTLRALHVLELADTIACEDTRHTQGMLRAFGVERRAGASLLAVHQHNEAEAAQAVIQRLADGERVAYVSDAGTPGVSDPGARLADAVRAAGHRVLPLPGASSITCLLSAAGLVGGASGAFVFEGFLPTKSGERASAVDRLRTEKRAVVLLEAPHRIEALATALAVLGSRGLTLGRELTKQFEEIVTLPAQDLPGWLAADGQRTRGEFALVLHALPTDAEDAGQGEAVLSLLMDELPLKTAVRLAAQISGAGRNELYQRALAIRKAQGDADEDDVGDA
ncbi:16S rRNA (cytidine(1402)-2'-O)-methyltransferase [Variovorax dokdonensis]|uniref:Ribosomal RNA small subunit methyltransferase I n=1 Tax=Variovorax dokdonensis TaxID=344883 RepID=A0ABT7NG88_9BURK|nr:16S rRNA (cytidine(1402)-2'-O)-methyltransferase [Variovorax dokdonensis]MDM0046946.1 16S rRNA (cytidine(1402)-2'-O)-methyltransferase [Variovorax dokdonensis]